MKILALLQNNNNSTTQSFLIASGIYGAVIASFFYSVSNFLPKDIGLQTQTMAISLSHFTKTPIEEKTPTPIPPKKEEIKPIEKPVKKIVKKEPIKKVKPIEKNFKKPIMEQKTAVQEVKPSNIPSSSKHINNVPPTLTFGKVNDPFLLSVKQAIDQNLHYPRKARQLRMTGTVLVEFTLLKEGRLNDVRVIESSKHELLNKSAVKTIVDAQNDFPTPKNDVIIRIPIQYVLI